MNQEKGVLLIGGNGFVGQSLIRHLTGPVYVISRHRLEKTSPHVHSYQAELDDAELLADILPKCRWVVHLASDSTPGTSAHNPLYEAERNLLPNLRLFQQLQDYPDVNLLYVSSGGAVYGNAGCLPIREDATLHPLSYYAAGKVSLEVFIMALVQQSPRTGVILRPSNIYGPGQKYRPGFGVIPTMLEYQRLKKPIQIWGGGENMRDYIYIDDFIDLCVSILDQKTVTNGVEVYNAGSGVGCGLNQLSRLIEEVTNHLVLREYHTARSIDVNHIVLDSSKAEAAFGWRAVTSLKNGLQKTWECWCSS